MEWSYSYKGGMPNVLRTEAAPIFENIFPKKNSTKIQGIFFRKLEKEFKKKLKTSTFGVKWKTPIKN